MEGPFKMKQMEVENEKMWIMKEMYSGVRETLEYWKVGEDRGKGSFFTVQERSNLLFLALHGYFDKLAWFSGTSDSVDDHNIEW